MYDFRCLSMQLSSSSFYLAYTHTAKPQRSYLLAGVAFLLRVNGSARQTADRACSQLTPS